jgi:hypothetical protein
MRVHRGLTVHSRRASSPCRCPPRRSAGRVSGASSRPSSRCHLPSPCCPCPPSRSAAQSPRCLPALSLLACPARFSTDARPAPCPSSRSGPAWTCQFLVCLVSFRIPPSRHLVVWVVFLLHPSRSPYVFMFFCLGAPAASATMAAPCGRRRRCRRVVSAIVRSWLPSGAAVFIFSACLNITCDMYFFFVIVISIRQQRARWSGWGLAFRCFHTLCWILTTENDDLVKGASMQTDGKK